MSIIKHVNGAGAPTGFFAGVPLDGQAIAVEYNGVVDHHHQGLPFTAAGRLAVAVDAVIATIGAGGVGFDASGRMVISSSDVRDQSLGQVNYNLDYPAPVDWYG